MVSGLTRLTKAPACFQGLTTPPFTPLSLEIAALSTKRALIRGLTFVPIYLTFASSRF